MWNLSEFFFSLARYFSSVIIIIIKNYGNFHLHSLFGIVRQVRFCAHIFHDDVFLQNVPNWPRNVPRTTNRIATKWMTKIYSFAEYVEHKKWLWWMGIARAKPKKTTDNENEHVQTINHYCLRYNLRWTIRFSYDNNAAKLAAERRDAERRCIKRKDVN